MYQIKKELKESNQGWTTKQAEELIVKKSGIKYHYTHIYRILRKWGFKQKVPRKVHVKHCIFRGKRGIQKKVTEILVDKHIQEQEQEQDAVEFTVVSLDESFFFYDFLVRRVWIVQDKRPIVRVTGSHQRSCVFGAISMEGKEEEEKKRRRSSYSDSMMNLMAIHSLII